MKRLYAQAVIFSVGGMLLSGCNATGANDIVLSADQLFSQATESLSSGFNAVMTGGGNSKAVKSSSTTSNTPPQKTGGKNVFSSAMTSKAVFTGALGGTGTCSSYFHAGEIAVMKAVLEYGKIQHSYSYRAAQKHRVQRCTDAGLSIARAFDYVDILKTMAPAYQQGQYSIQGMTLDMALSVFQKRFPQAGTSSTGAQHVLISAWSADNNKTAGQIVAAKRTNGLTAVFTHRLIPQSVEVAFVEHVAEAPYRIYYAFPMKGNVAEIGKQLRQKYGKPTDVKESTSAQIREWNWTKSGETLSATYNQRAGKFSLSLTNIARKALAIYTLENKSAKSGKQKFDQLMN